MHGSGSGIDIAGSHRGSDMVHMPGFRFRMDSTARGRCMGRNRAYVHRIEDLAVRCAI